MPLLTMKNYEMEFIQNSVRVPTIYWWSLYSYVMCRSFLWPNLGCELILPSVVWLLCYMWYWLMLNNELRIAPCFADLTYLQMASDLSFKVLCRFLQLNSRNKPNKCSCTLWSFFRWQIILMLLYVISFGLRPLSKSGHKLIRDVALIAPSARRNQNDLAYISIGKSKYMDAENVNS